MDRKLLSSRLREMATNTGTLNCLGCGYEHSCSTRGCAVLRKSAEIVESAPEWININDQKPGFAERVMFSDGIFSTEGYVGFGGEVCSAYGGSIDIILPGKVKLWAELPRPPEEETT